MATHTICYIFFIIFLKQMFFVYGNVSPSSTLSTNNNETWLSPSNEFAFGFRQITNTTLFMVAIWYNKIPDKTIVWSAKTSSNNNLVQAPKGSQLQLTSEGLSVTTTSQGESLWKAQPYDVVSYGSMLNTGNFVLVNNNVTIVWESFNYPTDTLLPNQSLELSGNLTSRFSETNYTNGKFQLYFEDNDLLLSPLAWPTQQRYQSYYSLNVSEFGSRLVFDELGDIYVETSNNNNGTRINLQGQKWVTNLVLDSKSYYYRATLDYYGVFTQYFYPRDNNNVKEGWTIMRYVPDNICVAVFNDIGSGSCGYNSYCSIENERPSCNCPYGYSLIDPSNQFGGCQVNFTLGCGADEEYELTSVSNVNWPLSDYESLGPYSLQDCQQSCLSDCNCAVAIFANLICWKKRLPLANGRAEIGGNGGLALIKTRVAPLGNVGPSSKKRLPLAPLGNVGPSSKKKNRGKSVLRGLLIGSTAFNSILLAMVVLVILLKPKKVVQAAITLLETNLHSFSYEALKEATWGFSEELGRGSFGIVYKGELKAASYYLVAVKKLDRLAEEREKEFRTELSAIGKTCHKNLVRLIGFCDEGVNRLLVYEFMRNGTLADVLFGETKPIWDVRVGFALGIARGLVYLHEECDTPIIHCDIKPQNILIDGNFTAKISDFGLAKLLLVDQSRTNTMIRGTKGYVAPEWFKNVPVTTKVDVYSFGAMLLEIICCRKSVLLMESVEEHKAILTDWACDCYMEGRIDVLVENDKDALADYDRLQNWVKVAIWCIQEHPEMRPTMKKVMLMLEGVVEVPNPPSSLSFSSVP